MMKFVLAAVAMVAAQPALAATALDYNVYASGNAYISGGSYGDIASGTFGNANGNTGNYTSHVAASTAETAAAADFSRRYKALASTGTVTSNQYTPGDILLTGSSAGTNVFNIDGLRWSQLYALTFTGPGTGAIVNVSGTSLTNSLNINFGSLAADKVVFNFSDSTTLRLEGMNVRGTILAPNASVTIQGGSVAGSVIARNFHSEGAIIGGNGYAGFAAASAVPEPASWALMILGFGLVGGVLRRRSPSRQRGTGRLLAA